MGSATSYAFIAGWLLVLIVPIGLIVRLFASPFSQSTRTRMKKHPILHCLWGIASLFILAPLFLPVRSRPSPQRHMMVYVKSIEMSSKQYFAEYSRFPLQTSAIDHTYVSDQGSLMSTLSGESDNPRHIKFLELPHGSLSKMGAFLDTWGNPFYVTADWSGDGTVMVGTNEVNEQIAVWSSGENCQNEFGSGDDVTSWK